MWASEPESRLNTTMRAPEPASAARSSWLASDSYTIAAPSSFRASLRYPPGSPPSYSSATGTDPAVLAWISGTREPQGFLQVTQQVGFLVRLAEIALDADFQRALAVLLAGARGDHNDRHLLQARVVL